MNTQVPLIEDLETFEANLEKFSNGALKGHNWSNLFLARGAVLGCLCPHIFTLPTNFDLDLFIHGYDTDEEANRKLKEVHEVISRNTGGNSEIIRTEKTSFSSHPSCLAKISHSG